MKEKLSVILPADTQIKIRPEDLSSLTYVLHWVATSNKTGEQHWLVEADDKSGIEDFKKLVKDMKPDFRPNHNHKGNKTDWTQNSFPQFQDGNKNPVEVMELGRDFVERTDKVNRRTRNVENGDTNNSK